MAPPRTRQLLRGVLLVSSAWTMAPQPAPALQADTAAAAVVVRAGADTTWLTHDELVEDVGQMADYIELTHPDPYGPGGKLAFHRRLHRLLRDLPEEGMSRDAFHSLLQPFAAVLGDGHTRVEPLRAVSDDVAGEGLPIDFRILATDDGQPIQALFVQGVAGSGSDVVGSRLETVAGVPIAQIIERERQWAGYENDFGNLQNLVWRLWSEKGLRELLPEWSGGDSVPVALRTREGAVRRLTLARGAPPHTWDGEGTEPAVILPTTRIGVPAFRFVDPDRRIALLRLDNTWAHREVFEPLMKFGQGSLSWAQSFYRSYYGKEAPADTAELVEALPAATEIFADLVERMRGAGTETLVVDLRRNSGGSSIMVNMLLYYLYGRRGWGEFFGNFYTIRRLTPGEVGSVDSTAAGRFPWRVGDYDFTGEFEAGTRTPSEAGDENYLRNTTISFATELDDNRYAGYYAPPRVVVVVAPRTYSGGFWVAAALRRMGARLVGVPSGQAGNAFANVRQVTLDNSEITVGVSSRLFVLFPEESGSMKVLPVDMLLTLEGWRESGYDPNAAVSMALRAAGNN